MLSTLLPYTSLETATSKSISGLLAEITGFSPRYFRGQIKGPRTTSGQRRLFNRVQEKAVAACRERDFPEQLIRDWQTEFDASDAPNRLLEYWLKQYNGPDPLFDLTSTFELAQEIDALSAAINATAENCCVEQLKDLLASDPRILRFNRPGVVEKTEVCPDEYLLRIQRCDTAEAWRQYVNVLMLNASMALLAQLDKETTAQYFRGFVPRHSFKLVIPVAKPKTNQSGVLGKRAYDFRIPPRRLLDLVACLGHYLEWGQFSTTVPPMSEFATQAFDIADGGTSAEKKLKRWLSGEVPLTLRQLTELWDGIMDTLELAGQPSNIAAPWPLYVAALYWQRMYVNSSRKGVKSVYLIDDDYEYWLGQSQDSSHGDEITEPWPSCFSRI